MVRQWEWVNRWDRMRIGGMSARHEWSGKDGYEKEEIKTGRKCRNGKGKEKMWKKEVTEGRIIIINKIEEVVENLFLNITLGLSVLGCGVFCCDFEGVFLSSFLLEIPYKHYMY